MAATLKKMSVLVAALGILSFVFGILAETKKPAAGVPIIGKGMIICKYPSDPTLAFAWLSFGFLVACSAVGWFSLFYAYKGKKAPTSAFFQSSTFVSFFVITLGTIGLAASFLLWPIITHHHPKYNITGNQNPSSATCPTAKTGVLGGGAFLSLNSSLLWLACFIFASNAREDYFEDLDGVKKPTHKHTHLEEAEAGPTIDDDSNEITSSSH
ncbi:hypothetical protein M0R45_011629 [Rubus argutus]|uniref:Uncharacterized protein n=1 Tax=Rubus argutus TaxID=59490 RepID=A0AAW1YBB7_RUBAR